MILVVEDSRTFGGMVKKRLETRLSDEVLWLETYADAKAALEEDSSRFSVAVMDLTLPDAPDGEIVELSTSYLIPTIVLTANFDEETRKKMWSKRVCDYVIKRGPHDMNYIVSLVERLTRNREIKVMVVYDSRVLREHVADLLSIHRYKVLQAKDGLEALEVLKNNPDIKLIVADYAMPNMDGLELTERIRRNITKEELAIIGLSVQGDNRLSAMFIKNGANDFLYTPFQSEEFYCRVTQNMDLLEQIEAIRNSAIKDYLTGLYNRRHFFDVGNTVLANARRSDVPIALAMMDIDHFKRVNDTYGHDVGDDILAKISEVMSQRVRKADLLARFGGEEFCIMATHVTEEQAEAFFNELRELIASASIPVGENPLSVTISIGVCAGSRESLDEMITIADGKLYEAKESGRNRVCMESAPQQD